ncbi:uncharacterized protein LOC126870173 isoform X1 [Bombus huntii]|uniref:uncharacterized protein LOC126870173 isoform X1 n=1 Tax=Bombus huntii TaxID=85661 RepID=UPI0021AA4AF3|nr:uncharacterized protein LOC126870173 isoform X1 [Bombus huntii]
MCEDALEKFTPLMNSTMDINSTYTQKMMDATAIVEPLSPIKSNETVVINKNLASSIGKNNEPKFTSRSPITLQEEVQQLNQAIGLTEFEELFAEDEPSREREMSNRNKTKQDIQNEMKKNVPVRRRIEAFEKEKISEKAIVQKLARRSVEKAKKILLAKQKKETQMMTSQVTLQTVSKYSSVIKTQAIIHSIFYPKYSSKQQGPLLFCTVNLTTTHRTMKPDQGVQFHIRRNRTYAKMNLQCNDKFRRKQSINSLIEECAHQI